MLLQLSQFFPFATFLLMPPFPPAILPLYFMSVGHACMFFGYSMSYTVLNIPLSILTYQFVLLFFFKILFIYFQREEKGERKRERNISVGLSLMHPLLGSWPGTQTCALTGNRTCDPLVCRPALNTLSHPSQGFSFLFKASFHCIYVLNFAYSFILPVNQKRCPFWADQLGRNSPSGP